MSGAITTIILCPNLFDTAIEPGFSSVRRRLTVIIEPLLVYGQRVFCAGVLLIKIPSIARGLPHMFFFLNFI